MKLIYLTTLTFPSKFVNRLQAMKTSVALARLCNFGLVIAESKKPLAEVYAEYTVAEFPITQQGQAKLKPRSFWQAWRTRSYIAQESENTVWYTRDVLLAFFLSFLSARFRRCYFFELHTLSRFPSFIYKRVLSKARGIITTNERKKKDMQDQFSTAAENILVAGNGVDIEEMGKLPSRPEARRILGLSDARLLAVYAGTVAEAYGSSVIQEAAHILAEEVDVITIAGQARQTALLHMAAADILLAPYLAANDHFRYYMSPMKVKEYMAIGRPIVVSDLPAVREIIDNSAAFLVEPGSAQSLVEAIRFIVSNPAEAKIRAERARALAHNFTWDKRAEAILEFIKKHE